MLIPCAIIGFELAVIIFLLVRYFRSIFTDTAAVFAILETIKEDINTASETSDALGLKIDNTVNKFKNDMDVKFGPDLVEKLNAIFKLGQNPNSIVIGRDGKPHAIDREY